MRPPQCVISRSNLGGWLRGLGLASRRSLRSSISSQNLSAVTDWHWRRVAAWRIRRSEEMTVSVLGFESPAISRSIRASAFSSPKAKQNAQPAIIRIELEIARVHRGIEDDRRLPGAVGPQRALESSSRNRRRARRNPPRPNLGPSRPACVHHVVSIDEPTHLRPVHDARVLASLPSFSLGRRDRDSRSPCSNRGEALIV